jgi:NAD(P)-dependent dehydrogenase (short-subunit alcohol dehydrogenase family)
MTRTILITGTSSDFGRETAERLATAIACSPQTDANDPLLKSSASASDINLCSGSVNPLDARTITHV